MKTVSLNVDLGELPDESEELALLATMVNVACGGHAGDASTMDRTVARALAAGAQIAAHPSYPDREGFGRRSMSIKAELLSASIAEQIGALVGVASRRGARIAAAKPHGALYHDAASDPALAEAFFLGLEAALPEPGKLVGPPRGELLRLAGEREWTYLREGFADRTYLPEGRLAPRSSPGALIVDPVLASEQALRLARSGDYDTICVHGDTEGAVVIARAVRAALAREGLLDLPRAES